MARRITREERVAVKLTDLVNDVTLNLDDVGKYMSYVAPTVSINRLSLVIEAAIDEREAIEYDIRG